jgi:Leucine-rich repeat (LRR) protein
VSSLSFAFPCEIQEHIYSFLITEGYGPVLSCIDKRSRDVVLSTMIHQASKIRMDSKKKTSIFYQFIQTYLNPNSLTTYRDYSSYFRAISEKAHSLGISCPKRILFLEEIHPLSEKIEQVQDQALEKIWPLFFQAIVLANSGTNLSLPDQNASGIRTWLVANLNLVQRVTILDLSHQNLQILPIEIGLFTSLKRLMLNNNQLTSLPSEIFQFKNLNFLAVSNNQLHALSPEIRNLTNLTFLEIANNQLSTLPSEIRELINLIMLYVSGNKLVTLSPEIGKLVNLQILDISKNHIVTIAPEVALMTKLKSLDASDNALTTFPYEIMQLSKLKSLDLTNNLITSVPLKVKQLTNLKALNI